MRRLQILLACDAERASALARRLRSSRVDVHTPETDAQMLAFVRSPGRLDVVLAACEFGALPCRALIGAIDAAPARRRPAWVLLADRDEIEELDPGLLGHFVATVPRCASPDSIAETMFVVLRAREPSAPPPPLSPAWKKPSTSGEPPARRPSARRARPGSIPPSAPVHAAPGVESAADSPEVDAAKRDGDPADERHWPVETAPPPIAVMPARAPRVAVVACDIKHVRAFSDALETARMSARGFTSARALVVSSSSATYDALVTEDRLDQCDAAWLADELVRSTGTAPPVVVLVPGDRAPREPEHGAFDAVIHAPAHAAELIAAVRNAIDRRAQLTGTGMIEPRARA
jgi:hypothetical protein